MNGLDRFDYYLNQVQELLDKSKAETNPGWWLFTNGLRTPVFMLEALAKLYSKLHDKTIFNKLQDRFKLLEDILGDIDYYNAYGEEFKNQAGVPASALQHFEEKKQQHIRLLNDELIAENWIGSERSRIDKIRKKLSEVSWFSEEKEVDAIKKFYLKAIESIKEFYNATGGVFNDMEEQVHELRRKIRWLSIYPQALRGGIQLSEQNMPEPYLAKYFAPEIVNSPFNKLPEPAGGKSFLYLDKNYFLANSWLISELGKLKDAGLGQIALEEASMPHRDEDPAPETETSQPVNHAKINEYLKKASEITKTFFDEGNLDKLVVD